MNNITELILRWKVQDGNVPAKTVKDIEQIGAAAQSTDAKLKGASSGAQSFATRLDQAGRNARIGLSTISQFTGTANAALGGMSGQAARVADAVGDLVGSFATMGPIGLAVTGVSVAVSGLIGMLREQEAVAQAALDRTRQYEEELRRPFEEVKKELSEFGRTDVFQGFADSIPLTVARVRELSQEIPDLREKFSRLATSMEGARVLEDRIATLNVKIRDLKTQIGGLEAIDPASMGSGALAVADEIAELKNQLREAENLLRVYEQSLQGATSAESSLRAEILGTNAALNEQSLALLAANVNAAGAARRFGEDYPDAFMRMTGTGKAMADALQRGGAVAKQLDADHKRLAAEGLRKSEEAMRKVAAAAEAVRAKFRGMVENALTPTEADPKMGDSWDEARKRFEAFASGTDTGAYGEKFKQMFESLGMSAEQAASKFKNFSLFADPEMLKKGLIDWGPVAANIEEQLLGIAGKANVVREAMKQVWANLSPTAKAALSEQGIESAGDAIKELVDPAAAANEKVAALGSSISAIPNAVTTYFKVIKDEAEVAIEEFRTVLDRFIADYRNVTVSISAQASAGGGGGGSSGGTPPAGSYKEPFSGARASGGYVKNGLYRVGEGGEEFVLPAGMVKWIESLLGHKIRTPDEIAWLVGALRGGKDEFRNQLGLFAGGITGWGGTEIPNADKWSDKIFKRYGREYGLDALPVSERATASSAGSGGGSGGGDGADYTDVLASIDHTLKDILHLMVNPTSSTGTVSQSDYSAITRMLGRGAGLRRALGG